MRLLSHYNVLLLHGLMRAGERVSFALQTNFMRVHYRLTDGIVSLAGFEPWPRNFGASEINNLLGSYIQKCRIFYAKRIKELAPKSFGVPL